MRQNMLQPMLAFCFSLFIYSSITSCNDQTRSLTQNQSETVRDSVKQMMNSISKDLSDKGPVAWLQYFENSPGFFMASDGLLVFPGRDSAESFINNTLVKQIQKIDLQWSNIQIDPLSLTLAGVAANWHEVLTDFANNKTAETGYFTAIAENTSTGWKLRNAHWSSIKSQILNHFEK